MWSHVLDLAGSGYGSCECGNELSGSIKCGEFLALLRTECSIGGMVLTGEGQSACRKTCPSFGLSTTNPTLIGQGLRLIVNGEKLPTNRHGCAGVCLTHASITQMHCQAFRERDSSLISSSPRPLAFLNPEHIA